MTREEIQEILDKIKESRPLDAPTLEAPTQEDWEVLEKKFGCRFGAEFRTFMSIMPNYAFPGELLCIAPGRPTEHGTIAGAYDSEMDGYDWNPRLIPFEFIGNGDYFCLAMDEEPNSAVYYRYHDDGSTEKCYDSFEDWIRGLPEFLNG
jgi:hypothetical protein